MFSHNDLFNKMTLYVFSYNMIHAVAEIGMVDRSIIRTEDETSIGLCVILINLVELTIPLTAYVQTQGVTATG